MQELKDLLTDSRFWAALLLVLQVVLPYAGVDVPQEVWLAVDSLVAAILAWLTGAQVLRKRKERQHINVCCE